ncbi:MAG: EFR1 family ferrodoxin, partial [Clostridia bacterium]|nr:EFR1 family ferrodoxin [Clostridia bacterium]
MILYFSGTGNSRFVARLIADALGDEAVSINEHLINGSERSFSSETPYVVVCPTYCYAIPTAVRDFLLSASFFTGSSNMYFVMTCGAGIGGAPYLNDRLCRRIGMNHM